MRQTASISKAHHYFKVHDFYEQFFESVIKPFTRQHLCKRVKKPGVRGARPQWEITHVFARGNAARTEYRFPSELLKDFIEFAVYKGYSQSRFLIDDVPVIEPKRVSFELNPAFSNPFPKQWEWINYMLDDGYIKINNDNTGGGKTFMSIYSMVQLGMRTVATMQPRYIHNFVKELYNVVKFGPGDVLIWEQDLSILKKVMDEGVYDPKVVIIPMSRIEVYLRHEKEGREQPTLDEVYESIRPGLRIIDEGHESIHQIFLSLCYGNLHKTFVLSATLRADDPFNNKAYSWLYPFRYRLKEAEPEHYIDIVFYMYRMNLRKFRIKTEQYGGYNDKTFEESILKSEVVLKFYFELIDKAFQEYYLGRRREGTKCFMFFSRVNMCYAMQKLFKDRYPHLDIETFTGDDTKKKELKDKYLKHEIIITTPNSCGTGKDAPGMITVLCPHTVSSTQANKQIIGRLRDTAKLFNGELPPIFVAFGCFDISKQCDYLDKRAEAFAPKKKTLTRVNSECALD